MVMVAVSRRRAVRQKPPCPSASRAVHTRQGGPGLHRGRTLACLRLGPVRGYIDPVLGCLICGSVPPERSGMSSFSFGEHPHRRYNPLTRQWVLVSPHRTRRPWQGQVERPPAEVRPAYDPTCYLGPGNERAGGARPGLHRHLRLDKEFAALFPDTPSARCGTGCCWRAVSWGAAGWCAFRRPKPDAAQMSPADVRRVVDVWVAQYEERGARPGAQLRAALETMGAHHGLPQSSSPWADLEQELDPAGAATEPASRAPLGEEPAAACCVTIWRKSWPPARG